MMEQYDEERKGYKRRRQSQSTSPLPIDLTSEILLRLPEKSVARFRCVSKLWLSISTDPYFIDLFETRSPRPSLLLCFRKDDNLYFTSIPQHTHSLHPQDSNKSYSSSQPTDGYQLKFSGQQYHNFPPTESVQGLICFQELENPIVWNPSKKQFLTLPKPRKSWNRIKVFLGYDPVQGKHKVMCMPYRRSSDVCQVLTLGSAQGSWRTVKTNYMHRTEYQTNGRCINGVIYYVAYVFRARNWVIMGFDVQSEKFHRIEVPSNGFKDSLLTYQGKLACADLSCANSYECRRLWILEDPQTQKWSGQDFLSIPFCPYNKLLRKSFVSRGFTHAGDKLIYVPREFSKSLFVIFHNPVRNSFRRFEFKGIAEGEEFDGAQLHAFPNHIESPISL